MFEFPHCSSVTHFVDTIIWKPQYSLYEAWQRSPGGNQPARIWMFNQNNRYPQERYFQIMCSWINPTKGLGEALEKDLIKSLGGVSELGPGAL